MVALSIGLAVALALVHIFFAARLRGPESGYLLSFVGGVAVGYVFTDILPAVCKSQALIERTAALRLPFLERRAFISALIGLVLYYGLLRKIRLARLEQEAKGDPSDSELPGLYFWLLVAGNAALSLLVGYLLLNHPKPGAGAIVLFSVAMAAHFLRFDRPIIDGWPARFGRSGRWVLAGAVLLGWGIGFSTLVRISIVATLLAFLAGAIILNVLREELPEPHASSFVAFALGATALMLLAAFKG